MAGRIADGLREVVEEDGSEAWQGARYKSLLALKWQVRNGFAEAEDILHGALLADGLGHVARVDDVLDEVTIRAAKTAFDVVEGQQDFVHRQRRRVVWSFESVADRIWSTGPNIPRWAEFVRAAGNNVEFDLHDRMGKRPKPVCLPLEGGRSRILMRYDADSPSSVFSLIHELGHAYLYWRIADLPELLRPRRGPDELVALWFELVLSESLIGGMTGLAKDALLASRFVRWHRLVSVASQQLQAELAMFRALDAIPMSVHDLSLSQARAVAAELDVRDVLLNHQLAAGEFESVRYFVCSVIAGYLWDCGNGIDVLEGVCEGVPLSQLGSAQLVDVEVTSLMRIATRLKLGS